MTLGDLFLLWATKESFFFKLKTLTVQTFIGFKQRQFFVENCSLRIQRKVAEYIETDSWPLLYKIATVPTLLLVYIKVILQWRVLILTQEIEMVITRLEEETSLAREECERAAENRIK